MMELEIWRVMMNERDERGMGAVLLQQINEQPMGDGVGNPIGFAG